MSENSTSKLGEILASGIAPGFPQKGRLDPQGCQAKALKGLREIENTPRYKGGSNYSGRDISNYMSLGSATDIKKTWERPFKKLPKRIAMASSCLLGAFLLFASVRTAEAGYITPGEALTDGQLIHAQDLNNLVGNAIIGSGFISSQPINNNPLTSDYILDYSPTLNSLNKVLLANIFNNPSSWTTLSQGIPSIYTNDLFQYFSQANQSVMAVTSTNFSLFISSNLQPQYVRFAPTNNNTGATNAFVLNQMRGQFPWQSWQSNQVEFLVFTNDGIPQMMTYTDLIQNATAMIDTNITSWTWQQIFTPWTVYGTNTFSPLTPNPPFTNGFGTNVVVGPVVSVFETNSAVQRTNIQVLNDNDTIPFQSSFWQSNNTATLQALFSYMSNKFGLPPYNFARNQFSGLPVNDTITNWSLTTGVVTNDSDALNWSNAPQPIAWAGKATQIPTSPTVQSNVVYWAYGTNVPNFLAFQIYTNFNDALNRVHQILGNGVSPTASGTLVWLTNFTSVNLSAIQDYAGTSVNTGIYDLWFLTPSGTPFYYVSSMCYRTASHFPTINFVAPLTTNSFQIEVNLSGSSPGVDQSPLLHILVYPQ